MMGAGFYETGSLRRMAMTAIAFAAFAAYVAVATMATLFVPAAFVVFLAPLVLISIAAAPRARCAPKHIIMLLIFAGAALMPLWPTYLHLKLGPAPIITPPRLIFYAVTAFWLYDMAASPIRRGQFLVALKRSFWLSAFVVGFFVLNAISVPIAEGTRFAGQEFFRQIVIWFLPFCAYVTYVRKFSEFKTIVAALTISAAIAAAIAIIELGTGTLLATKLAPFISADAEWLRIAQELKNRDGVFRAQSTHTHPLSLGEYLGMCAPLALAFAVAARKAKRALWLAILIIILCGLAATNSRGALFAIIAGLGLTGGVIIIGMLRDKRLYRFRPVIGLASLFLIAASPVLVAGAHQVISGDSGTSAARSSQGRIDQIKMAWPKIVKRPIGGYGTGRAARIIGYWGRTLSVDNYYLSLAVELGFPGPVCFLGIMIIAGRSSWRRSRFLPPDERWVLIGFAGALAAFAISRTIISQTGNLAYFYPLLGAYIGAAARGRHQKA